MMTEEEANTFSHYFPFIGGWRRGRDRRFGSKGVSRGLPIPNFFVFLSGAWAMGTTGFSSDASSLDVLQQSNPNETPFSSLGVVL